MIALAAMIRRPGKGVDQQLVRPARALPLVEQIQVLPCQTFREKITRVAALRHAVGIDTVKLREPLRDCVAPGEFRESRFRTLILGVYPRACLFALLVLEPAVRIGHDGCSVRVLGVFNSGWRRALCCAFLRFEQGRSRHQQNRTKRPASVSRCPASKLGPWLCSRPCSCFLLFGLRKSFDWASNTPAILVYGRR